MKSDFPYRVGALAFILDEQDRLLLVQLNAYKDNEWNVPGGGREGNESPLENIHREITEEIGIDPADLKLLGQAEEPLNYDFPADIDLIMNPLAKVYRGQQKDAFVFRCPEAVKSQIKIDPSELKDMFWCPAGELERYLVFPDQTRNYYRVIKPYLPK